MVLNGSRQDRLGSLGGTATPTRKLGCLLSFIRLVHLLEKIAFIIHILGLFITKRHTHAKKVELLLTVNHTPIWQIILKHCDLKTAGITGSNILAAADTMK